MLFPLPPHDEHRLVIVPHDKYGLMRFRPGFLTQVGWNQLGWSIFLPSTADFLTVVSCCFIHFFRMPDRVKPTNIPNVEKLVGFRCEVDSNDNMHARAQILFCKGTITLSVVVRRNMCSTVQRHYLQQHRNYIPHAITNNELCRF